MLNRNRTGLAGQGPRSGRGAGNCNGQGNASLFGGRGFGGLGASSGQDRSWLEDQVKSLQSALQGITERLDAMKKE